MANFREFLGKDTIFNEHTVFRRFLVKVTSFFYIIANFNGRLMKNEILMDEYIQLGYTL